MSEVLLFMAILFAAYLLMTRGSFDKAAPMENAEEINREPTKTTPVIPEDSVLRRHFITQLRSEIEKGLYHPRPAGSADSALKRHYDAMVEAELENRLAASRI